MNIANSPTPDPTRPFKSLMLSLGAYQFLKLIPADLGEQYTNGGKEPLTLFAQLITAIDDPFVNRTISVLLTEEAQQDIAEVLDYNLHNNLDGINSIIKKSNYSFLER